MIFPGRRRALLAALSFAFISGSAHAGEKDAPPPLSTPASIPALLIPRPADAPDGDYGPYLTYAEVQAKIAGWAKDHPDLITVSSLGRTLEGRDIPLIRLSAAPEFDLAGEPTPEVMLLSGIHPREQQPVLGVASLVDELISNYKKDALETYLLKERVIWIVPIFNVDGKVYDMKHGNGTNRGADWRKNREPNADGTFGVDLNRNFGVRWGGNHLLDKIWQTTTDTPEADIYEGAGPLSEPEDRALVNFVVSRRGKLRAFIDLHSPFGELLTPTYLIAPEYDRYNALLDGMHARQKDPYPATKIHRDEEPPPGIRSGDTGISYTYMYYTQGVYALNLEYAPPKEARRGVIARYAPPAEIDEEYRNNVRGVLLYFIDAGGALPLAHSGSATVAAGNGTLGGALSPGASAVGWTPPAITGPWDAAVLVSEGGEIGVSSEYRKAPLDAAFTLEVSKKARPGATVPMTLYLWDKTRGLSTAHFIFTVAAVH